MKPSAANAIHILEKLADSLPIEQLAYWVTPNAILTFSGARVLCDGVFWSDDEDQSKEWQEEIKTGLEVIRSVGEVYSAQSAVKRGPQGNSYASYNLSLSSGFQSCLDQTDLLGVAGLTTADLVKDGGLHAALCRFLQNNPRLGDVSSDDIKHIAFGILLGYPDKAILGATGRWTNKDPFAEPLIHADIRGAGYYKCPQPVYSYPRGLVADPEIIAHEKLWSRILKDYYMSDFHKALEAHQDFRAKLAALGMVGRTNSHNLSL